MTDSKKQSPANHSSRYKALGELLIKWRKSKFKYAVEFHEFGKFSFEYSTYKNWERGFRLPSIGQVEEIAAALGTDPLEGFLKWAEVQVEGTVLKQRIRVLEQMVAEPKRRDADVIVFPGGEPKPITSNLIDPKDLENTWCFYEHERRAFLTNPSLFKFILSLQWRSPHALPFSAIVGLETQSSIDTFIRSHLQRWIDDGRIVVTKAGFRLKQKHIWFPNDNAWRSIREKALGETLDEMLPRLTPEAVDARKALVISFSRFWTREQIQTAMARLSAEALHDNNLPILGEQSGPDKELVSVVMMVTNRDEKVHVRGVRKVKRSKAA